MRAKGIDIPVVPWHLPISNFSQIRRFSEMCGAEIPRWVSQRMVAYADDAESIRAFGTEVVPSCASDWLPAARPA